MSGQDETVPRAPRRERAPRRRWDGFRRIAAWAGLLEVPGVLGVVALFGRQLSGSGPSEATTWGILLILGAPAVLAGLVSGSRFFTLYADYAERLDPTAELSESDAARGARATSSVMGDALWGALIAGCAGAVPGTIALGQLVGPLVIVAFPLLALVIGLAWFTGWAIGVVVGLILSTALGIAIGSRRRANRLLWTVSAILLPVLLVAVAIPVIGVRFVDGRSDAWAAIMIAAGIPVADSEFVLGEPVLWVARIAIWLALVLVVVVVVAGTPALLRRRGLAGPAASPEGR